MKHIAKRSFSLILALILCLNLLPGLSLTADAVTPSMYNWGSRGTTATYLSDSAENFYAKNQVSYEDWTALEGGTANNAYTSTLYSELQELMESNHTYKNAYKETNDFYKYTDCQNGGGRISSFYSGLLIGPEWDGGSTWNKEHTWPNSKGMEGSDEDDIMMLRPTSKQENTSRGNTAYGVSSGYFDPNKDSGNQYNVHGDVARIMLYVYVRWGNTKIWGSSGVMESLDVLLDWMEEDPVDTWELGRNDVVQTITGTRNVFVDYPELAFLLFNQAVPGSMATPSGKAAEKAYNITATSNNDEWGTVEVSGMNINATPAEGYRAAGYQVISGTATAEQKGNVFVVDAESECTIQIIFEKRKDVTVTFLENGSVASSANKLEDDVITMPGHTGTVPEGYSFRGWVTGTLAETDAAPANQLVVGQTYTLTGDVTFHALYSRLDTGGTGAAQHFERYTGTITEGDYLIVDATEALKAAMKGVRLDFSTVEVVNDTVSYPSEDLVWHIAPTSDGYWTIYNQATGVYAAGNGTKNQGVLSTTASDFAKWTPTGSKTYEFENKGNDAAGVNDLLRKNSTYGFATYSTATGSPIMLFKGNSGTTYYTTSTVSYEITAVSSNDAWGTVSLEGSTITAVPAYGYQVGSFEVTDGEADVSRQGNTFHVTAHSDCTVKIHFVEREKAVYAIYENGKQVNSWNVFVGDTVELPAYSGTLPAGYTFVGWTDGAVSNTEQAPIFNLKPNAEYVISGNETLHALYKATFYTTSIYTITAESGNETFGTVSVSGQTITAQPAEGYQVAGFTVVSGEVNVTRKGNVLTVKASSDCTIRVDFEERTTSQVTFLENGKTLDSVTKYPGETVTVPEFSGELLDGYTFIGWTTEPGTAENAPELIYLPGHVYTVDADVTFHTLYRAGKYTTDMVEIPRVITLSAEEVGDAKTAWVDGREYPIQLSGETATVAFGQGFKPTNLVIYTYHIGDEADVHTHYPIGMQIWSVALTDGAYVATRHAGLDNLLQYSGCSIRITGKKGIRMITSVDKDQKAALTGKGLEGYTLVEYGTLLCFASDLEGGNPMILGQDYSRSNHAYKKDANGKVEDPVFAYNGNQVQYTNVLVGFSLDQCKDDIAMRPYIILKDADGQEITVYGGVIYRSIGYIATQNRTVFKSGTAAYDYVWEIIHHVYGEAFDADYEKKGE